MKNLIDQKIQELATSLSKRLSMEITASTASSTIKLNEELRITIFLLEKAIQKFLIINQQNIDKMFSRLF